MARGGINLFLVKKARDSLVGRGQFPSIDAVRAELGNTGSKTTISRYLKELQGSDKEVLATDRLSGALQEAVATLLDQVKEEGAQAFLKERAELADERTAMLEQVTKLEQEQEALRQEMADTSVTLASQKRELETALELLQTERIGTAGLSQRCAELEIRLGDRESHIRSLDEKHAHARDALEHYREAVKTQREQDQQRHDSQLQQVQVENRKLQEMLVVKQDESTRLNRDNERLIGELRQLRSTVHTQGSELQSLSAQIQTLTVAEAQATALIGHYRDEAQAMRDEIKTLNSAAIQSCSREGDLQRQIDLVMSKLEQPSEVDEEGVPPIDLDALLKLERDPLPQRKRFVIKRRKTSR